MKIFYFFPNLKKDVVEFIFRCLDCQQVKAKCKHPGGRLHSIVILEWKLEVISMEFITSFPRKMRQHDSIIVIVEKLTKVAHFIRVMSTFSLSDVA